MYDEPESEFEHRLSDESNREREDAAEREADEADEHDQFLTDAEADGDALRSAGFGTDEDYGGCSDLGDDF